MKNIYLIVLFMAPVFFVSCKKSEEPKNETVSMGKPAAQEASGQLPGENKKCLLNDGAYFIYQFADAVQMGTVVLRVQIFDAGGKQVSGWDVRGYYGMPSMRGHHDSGEQVFQQNKKGDYLLPVNIAMPGEWEMNLIFLKDKKEVYRGLFTFSV